MTAKCDSSILIIPNDLKYSTVVRSYISSVASSFAFSEEEIDLLSYAVWEAAENVILHSFEPDEKSSFEIECERFPLGLKIFIRDKGLPFDLGRNIALSFKDPESDVKRQVIDEIHFYNLGHQGKQIQLTKFLPSVHLANHSDACLVKFPPTFEMGENAGSEISVRFMEPAEAIDISRTTYETYGYSYALQHVYYPDRLTELVKSGQWTIAVAVSENGEVVGHSALIRHHNFSEVAEIGFGAVRPAFRGFGIFGKLASFLIQHAETLELTGIYVQAVTNHSYSQRTALNFGFSVCALSLASVPETESFRGITPKLPQRESLLLQYKMLKLKPEQVIYLPATYHEIAARMFQAMALPRKIEHSCLNYVEMSFSVCTVQSFGPRNVAGIFVHQIGADALELISNHLLQLRFQKIEVVQLVINAADPGFLTIMKPLTDLGFFFSGVLPGFFPQDAVILQYLNNIRIDYTKLIIVNEMGRDLVSFIKKQDPNQ